MADAFRGLTIRLGADARPLNSAINSITSSAAQAQKQLNRLNKAAKFDGANAAMMQSRIDLMGDKAMHSAKAFEKIKIAMRQAAAESSKLTNGLAGDKAGFAKLVNGTKEAHYATQKLRDELYTVDASLQHMYDSMARVVMRTKELGKTDDVLKSAAMRMKGLSEEGAADYVKKLKEQMKGTGEAAEKAKSEFKELVAGVHNQDAINYVKKLGDETRKIGPEADKAREEFKRLMTEAASSSGLAEKFGKDKNDAQGLIEVYKKLREQHKALSKQQEAYNAVEGFRAMKVEAQAYRAELRQSVAETARLKSELYALGTGGRLMTAASKIRALDEATEKAVASAHQMIDAYKAAPMSFGAAEAKARAVAAAEETLRQKTIAIKDAMKRIEDDPAFDKLKASSKGAYANAVRIEQEYTKLGTALDIVQARLDELNKTKRNMDARGVDRMSNEYKKNANSIKLAEGAITKLKTRLRSLEGDHAAAAQTIQFKEFETQLAATTTQAAALHNQVSRMRAISNIGKSFREFGFGMYASLTPAIMMAGRYALQSAEDTDKAYRDMRKTVNGTEEQFEHLRDAALEFSRTHVTTAETMLEIEAMGGQLGIQVENLESFAHTVSNLDIATNMEADDIATKLGKFATVMGMSEDEYDKFGDALVRLGNNMPALEGDVMTITGRFMGMGKVVGMSADQMLAWSTAATATGQLPYAAGSSMQRFINNVNLAVSENGDALKEWASVAGMTSDEFSEAFKTDASGALYSIVEGLGEMQKSGGDVGGELKKLGVNTVQYRQLLLGLANQMANATDESNVLGDSLQMANDAYNGRDTLIHGKWEKAGDALREAERKSEGFSGSMQKMRNQATFLANELADGAAPIVQDLGSLFGDLAGAVGEMPQEMKTLIVGAAGVLAALGPVSVGLGTFLQSLERIGAAASAVPNFFTKVASGIKPLDASSKAGTKALSALQKAMKFMGTTGGTIAFAGVVTAIGLVTGAIADAIKKSEDYKKATEGLKESVADTIPWLNQSVNSTLEENRELGLKAKKADDLAASQAAMADKIKSTNESAKGQIAQLSAAQKVLDDYVGKTGLSAREQGQLRAAVSVVNDICGTQISVVDSVNGKLADETGAIMDTVASLDEYIQKKKESLRADALSSGLSVMYAQEADLLSKLTKEYSTYQEGLKKYYAGELTTEEAANFEVHGKDEYEKALKMYEDLQTQIKTYETQLGASIQAQEDASNSLGGLVDKNIALTTAFSGNTDLAERFKSELEQYGMTTSEFGKVSDLTWTQVVSTWATSGRDLSNILDEFGFHAKSALEQYKSEMESTQGSTKAWEHAMKVTGKGGDELAAALGKAGVSATEFATVGSSAFDALWQMSGQSLDGIAKGLSLVDSMGFEPKDLKINDDGVIQVKDTVLELDGDIARLGNREFKLNADTGKFEEVKKQVQEISEDVEEGADMEVEANTESVEEGQEDVDALKEAAEEGATMPVNVDSEELKALVSELFAEGDMSINAAINFTSTGSEEVTGTWNSLKSAVEEGVTGKVDIDDSSITDATSATATLGTAVNNLPNRDISIVVTGGALASIQNIQHALNNMTTYKEINIHTVRTSSGDKTATGAIFNSRGKIPLNAAGALNGIVTRAMMTNIGWVGEAGSEAVFHMRNAGGAVVPLSNRRYVRPFARAVASEMGGFGSTSNRQVNVTVNLDYSAGDDGTRIAFDIADKLGALMDMEA